MSPDHSYLLLALAGDGVAGLKDIANASEIHANALRTHPPSMTNELEVSRAIARGGCHT